MWADAFAHAWDDLAPRLDDGATYTVVGDTGMANRGRPAEYGWNGVVYCNRDYAWENATEEQVTALAHYVVAHERGHLACYRESGDVSEACADAFAAALGYSQPVAMRPGLAALPGCPGPPRDHYARPNRKDT